ncbi:hypothetical protein TSEDIMI_450005 [Tenacibaculum sediminilitoris]|uniref:RHS repeat domain-containing protein n=1 Tax=Tenacibaculum sediminilitoris TaxID=1820334 RepID=UPI0038963427
MNRIVSAIDNTGRYNLQNVTYDKNGNIKTLVRKGHLNVGATSFGTMDNLTYTYDNGNKLMRISDGATIDQFGFKDDVLGSTVDTTDDYTYDANGNMLTDTNKGITSNITYNHLNLPVQINVGGQPIKYTYDASGAKLKKVSNGVTTEYAGGFRYVNGALKDFKHAEGYVKNDNDTFNYVYSYTDHIGNVRLNYADLNNDGVIQVATEILDEKNYYPFGGTHEGYNTNVNGAYYPFGYNGKEENDENGLATLDFGSRNYDKWAGRWMNIDPLAEKFVEVSPYSYAKNNPIFFVDPDGQEPVPGPFTGKGSKSSNGTITVHRITAGQRYALNIYYATAVTFTGRAGQVVGLYDSLKTIGDNNKNTQTRAGVASQVALEGSTEFLTSKAAKKGIGQAFDRFGNVIKNGNPVQKLAKNVKGGLGAIGIVAAVTSNSDPSRDELMSKWTFQFAESVIPGGNINIVQDGLFDVRNDKSTVQGVESRLNAIHASIGLFLSGQDFDLTTKEGVNGASKYITENAKYISSMAKLIYSYYNNKKDEENK